MGILRMMKNAYGNYVVQRLYEYCDEESRNRVYAKINQPDILSELRKNNYGTHLILYLIYLKKNCQENMFSHLLRRVKWRNIEFPENSTGQ